MAESFVTDRDLARHLDEQIDAMQSVLAALEAEQQALKRRDADALLQAVNGKATSLARADELEKRRQTLIEQTSFFESGRSGRPFSTDAGITHRWQQLLALAHQCRAINDSNGLLIRGQRRRVDMTLQILRGSSAAPAEYGPGGESRSRAGARNLGSY
jgi:flagellar biosynthesis/type III secretory pathway chaperone